MEYSFLKQMVEKGGFPLEGHRSFAAQIASLEQRRQVLIRPFPIEAEKSKDERSKSGGYVKNSSTRPDVRS